MKYMLKAKKILEYVLLVSYVRLSHNPCASMHTHAHVTQLRGNFGDSLMIIEKH